jgi:mannitol/fructose-specific phosphotransferase system IIA component
LSPDTTQVLTSDAVRLGLTATDKHDALRQCGAVLVELGAASEEYAAAILEREESVSTYMGEGVAIPHGTDASRAYIARAALAVLQFPDGVDWDGNQVQLCIPIASRTDEHIGILQSLATVLIDPGKAARLRETDDVSEVLALLTTNDEEDESA